MQRRHGSIPSRPPGLELSEADWQKRFTKRAELIAEVSNRPPLKLLRSHFVCPMPPNIYLRVGSRVWRNQFILWREFSFAMARDAGFDDRHRPDVGELPPSVSGGGGLAVCMAHRNLEHHEPLVSGGACGLHGQRHIARNADRKLPPKLMLNDVRGCGVLYPAKRHRP